MKTYHFLVMLVGTYIWASIPWSWIYAKVFLNTDLRKVGSKNPGWTNLKRVLKFSHFSKFVKIISLIITLTLDIFRGIVPLMVLEVESPYIQIIAITALLGNFFPVFLGIHAGGKGITVGIGLMLMLNSMLGIFTAIYWLTTLFLFQKDIGHASIMGALAAVLLASWNIYYGQDLLYSNITVILIATGIILRHAPNRAELNELIKNMKVKKEANVKKSLGFQES